MIPLRDDKRSGRFPVQTLTLIFFCAAVFYFELRSSTPMEIFSVFGLIPSNVQLAESSSLLPFITAIFIHGSFIHVALNMWFLWIFGDNVEAALGTWFLPVFIIGGIIGNVIQYLTMPDGSIPVIGASGAVAAVLGAYLVLFPKNKIITVLPLFLVFPIITIPATAALVIWFFTQFFNGYAVISANALELKSGVAWFAHVGGFAFGLAVGLIRAIISERMIRSHATTRNHNASLPSPYRTW